MRDRVAPVQYMCLGLNGVLFQRAVMCPMCCQAIRNLYRSGQTSSVASDGDSPIHANAIDAWPLVLTPDLFKECVYGERSNHDAIPVFQFLIAKSSTSLPASHSRAVNGPRSLQTG